MAPNSDGMAAGIPATCTAVLFDGSCPLCTREIGMYSKLPSRTPIAWIDISSPQYQPPIGTTRAALMQRFHVVTPNHALLSGAHAFVHVWSQLPGWRHLARLASVPGVLPAMELVYRLFLVIRPWMQSMYRRMPTQPWR
jgi:ubiquinone biosynthesis monooxygenase Coq7